MSFRRVCAGVGVKSAVWRPVGGGGSAVMLAGFMPVRRVEEGVDEEASELASSTSASRPRALVVLGLNVGWLLLVAAAAALAALGSRMLLALSARSAAQGVPPVGPRVGAPPPPRSLDDLAPRGSLPAPANKLAVRGVRFEWNGISPVFLSGINHPWLSYGHDFGRDRGVAHFCQMRQVLLNASKVRSISGQLAAILSGYSSKKLPAKMSFPLHHAGWGKFGPSFRAWSLLVHTSIQCHGVCRCYGQPGDAYSRHAALLARGSGKALYGTLVAAWHAMLERVGGS